MSPSDPTARQKAAALARFRRDVAVDREQAKVRSRSLAAKWRSTAECVSLGISKGELARIAATTPNMVREWCAKGGAA